MNETKVSSVIPDGAAEAIAPVSPELQALRDEAELAASAVFSIGEMPIKCKEAEKAAKLLKYLDGIYSGVCKRIDNQIASEMLGKPVEVNGTVLSLKEPEVQH